MKASERVIHEWLQELHGKSSGLLHVCSTGDWTGRRVDVHLGRQEAVDYFISRDAAGVSGCYLRATTIIPTAPTDHGKRAGAAHSASLPGLWADIDIAGPGHKHTPNYPDMPNYNPGRALVYPLPPDIDTGYRIVDEAGLLCPTLWIHSGGGLYPWWLLNEPEELEGDSFALDAAMKLSDGWQRALIAAAHRLGVDYGNVGDLARVLRVPGTMNRKADPERPCAVFETGGPRYTFDSLAESLMASQQAHSPEQEQRSKPPIPAPVTISGPLAVPPQGPREGSPLDAFEDAVGWDQILEPAGWTLHHASGGTSYWTRPGKRPVDGVSATTGHDSGRDRMFVFSTSAGLPVQESMTKSHVWGLLNGYGTDNKAVAKALVSQGFGTPLATSQRGYVTPLGPQVTQVTPQQQGVQAPVALMTAQQAVQPAAPPLAPPPAPDWCPTPVVPGSDSVRLPAFPVECLPPAMADQVRYVAASKQVDPTMPALFALSMLSAVAAKKMQVWGGGTHYEALSLYTCVSAESGERKSPTGREMFGPLGAIERRMADAHDDDVNQQIDELDQQRATAKGNPAAANRIEDKIAALDKSRSKPPAIQLADDITPEALTRALSRQGGHGAILDAEGTFMAHLCGRYTNGSPNPELFIRAYDGDRYHAERIGRDSDRIARPTLAIAVAVQQVVLDQVMGDKQLLERGAVARFMFGFPESMVGKRSARNTPPLDSNPGRVWDLVIEGINELPGPDDSGRVPALALSPEALDAHLDYTDSFGVRMAPGGDMAQAGMREWANKYCGRVLRLAALLHLADGNTISEVIPLSTYRAAMAIGEWSIHHARHAHRIDRESVDEATVKQCVQVLEWIARTGQKVFSNREACRGVRARWVSKKSMEDALDQLSELGWLREQQVPDRANRWRTKMVVTPYINMAAQAATM